MRGASASRWRPWARCAPRRAPSVSTRSCSPMRRSTSDPAVPRRTARRPGVPLRLLGRLGRDDRGDGAHAPRRRYAETGRRLRRDRCRRRAHRCTHRCGGYRGRAARCRIRRDPAGRRGRLRGQPRPRPFGCLVDAVRSYLQRQVGLHQAFQDLYDEDGDIYATVVEAPTSIWSRRCSPTRSLRFAHVVDAAQRRVHRPR